MHEVAPGSHAVQRGGDPRIGTGSWSSARHRHERTTSWKGDARRAQLVHDAAEVLRRLLYDLTGEVASDVDQALSDPREDWKERMLGQSGASITTATISSASSSGSDRHRSAAHVFAESDKELIGGLIDAIWGDHR